MEFIKTFSTVLRPSCEGILTKRNVATRSGRSQYSGLWKHRSDLQSPDWPEHFSLYSCCSQIGETRMRPSPTHIPISPHSTFAVHRVASGHNSQKILFCIVFVIGLLLKCKLLKCTNNMSFVHFHISFHKVYTFSYFMLTSCFVFRSH